MGPGVQRHHQHRASTCSSPRSSTSSPTAGRWTSRRRSFPAVLAARKTAVRLRRRRVLGGRGHARRPTSRRTRTSSTRRSSVDVGGFPLRPGVWLGKGAEIDPSATIDGPGGHRGQLLRRPGGAPRRVLTLGRERPDGRRAPSLVAFGGPRQRATSARWSGVDGCVLGRSCDLRQGVACEEGAVLGEEAWSAPTPRSGRASRSTRSRRWRPGPSSTPRSSGSRGGPASLSAGTASRAWPTSTSAPSWSMRLSMAWASHVREGGDHHRLA